MIALVKCSPMLILSDLHLGPATPPGADLALETLLDRHGQRELVCLGDLFDLSTETRKIDPAILVAEQFANHPVVSRALRRHLVQGSTVTLVAGNHDAELTAPDARKRILDALDLDERSSLRIEPWWLLRDGVYFEHGHVWDPDNAPMHPLAPTDRRHEPLGVALTRQVLAPASAYQFAHAHQTTPLAGLLRALRELKFRAPEVIGRYFVAGRAHPMGDDDERPPTLTPVGHACDARLRASARPTSRNPVHPRVTPTATASSDDPSRLRSALFGSRARRRRYHLRDDPRPRRG